MNYKREQYRNYMDEMANIIGEIEYLKPEPEVCNVRCPPLGCPRGPCPGMCCYNGVCDACCISKMPCCPPLPQPPRCRAPPLCYLRAYAKAVGYPPESCLSPQNARNHQKSNCLPRNPQKDCSSPKQPPFCTTVPICRSPCCPDTAFKCC